MNLANAKRYYGGQVKSHKCQFGGTSDRTKIGFIDLSKNCLELTPVVEKPEIVKQKEQRLKTLGSKYIVKVFS